jgi:hypothetical protein
MIGRARLTITKMYVGMLYADVYQTSVGSPPTSTDGRPMFQPMGRRSADKHGLSVDRQQGIGRQSPDCLICRCP